MKNIEEYGFERSDLVVSKVSVSVSLPYSSVVYNLPEPSANAKRCRKWKERKAAQSAAGKKKNGTE